MTAAEHPAPPVRWHASIGAGARLSMHDRTDAGAVVRIEGAGGAVLLSVAAEVFPRLVDLIQFAALSPPPPIPADAPAPGTSSGRINSSSTSNGVMHR